MNKGNLQAIFDKYINGFDKFNDFAHAEFFKWKVCTMFPELMNKALNTEDENFSKALFEVKKCTYNIIDGYTQPFFGLVEHSKDEPATVKKLFRDLYADDGADLQIRMEKIADFFAVSDALLEKYTPGSHLYKQNSHSVSSYLFLNDPENHYMYKAVQSKHFADCIEFYDSWGTGDNINLKIYHRMCDELVSHIKENKELLTANEKRYDGRFDKGIGKLHPDNNKHSSLIFSVKGNVT